MVPSALVRLDSISLTSNGKVDKARLPKPDMGKMGGVYTPPATPLEHEITKIWSELLNIEASKISVTDNYFQLGGNSLSIVKMIVQVKEQTEIDVPVSQFLRAPTIRDMTKLVGGCLGSLDGHISKVKQLILNDLSLPDMIQPLAYKNEGIYRPRKVFITGATGFLGSYMVNELCKMTDVEIYCLIRAPSKEKAQEKLNESLIKNQLGMLADRHNIHVVCGDLEHENLGLNKADHEYLSNHIDVIYHNGALVHHLYDYERMRMANVKSTHEMLKLATMGKNKAVHFVSTISVAGFDIRKKLNGTDLNWSFLELNGYLLTKWVSEQLIIQAANRGVVAHIFRPGNITGHSETGFCVPEYNHTLLKIKGFIQLGQAYYDDEELLEMMPVDLLAKNIVGNSLCAQKKIAFNLDNPNKIRLSDYVQKFVSNHYKIERISSLGKWQEILAQIKENNALYLLKAFYEQDHVNQDSPPVLSDVGAESIDYGTLVTRQIKYLQEVEFIPTTRL